MVATASWLVSLPSCFPFQFTTHTVARVPPLKEKSGHAKYLWSFPTFGQSPLHQGPLQLKQPIFLASSPTKSPHFWTLRNNSLFPIHTMNSHLDSPLGMCEPALHPTPTSPTWPVKPSSRCPSHLVHISIRTLHTILHLLFCPVSPTDHEFLVYKNYICLIPVFPELCTGLHINNESAKDHLLFLMA